MKSKTQEVIAWLDGNSLAEKEEYEEKEEDLKRVCSPIMAKLHGQQQPQQSCRSSNGPTVDDVD